MTLSPTSLSSLDFIKWNIKNGTYFSINSTASSIWQRAMQYLTSELYRARSIDSRFFKRYHRTIEPVCWLSFLYFYTVEEFNVYFPITKDQYPSNTPTRDPTQKPYYPRLQYFEIAETAKHIRKELCSISK